MQFVICFVSSPGVAIAALTRERSPGSTDTELEWALAGLAVVAPKISLTDMTNDLHQKCLDSVCFSMYSYKKAGVHSLEFQGCKNPGNSFKPTYSKVAMQYQYSPS